MLLNRLNKDRDAIQGQNASLGPALRSGIRLLGTLDSSTTDKWRLDHGCRAVR